jgi:hypothetical protein
LSSFFFKLINDSKEKAMDPQFLDHFESSYKEAMKEQELLRNLEDALSVRIKEIINEFFPDQIQRLSAEGYKQLSKIVTYHAMQVAMDVTNVVYREEEVN